MGEGIPQYSFREKELLDGSTIFLVSCANDEGETMSVCHAQDRQVAESCRQVLQVAMDGLLKGNLEPIDVGFPTSVRLLDGAELVQYYVRLAASRGIIIDPATVESLETFGLTDHNLHQMEIWEMEDDRSKNGIDQ